MRALELINDAQPALRIDDSVQKGIENMEDHKVYHLPVVDGRQYQGIITEDLLMGHFNPHSSIGELVSGFQEVFVYGFQHIFDVAELLAEHQLTSIAVLDIEKNYLGSILARDLLFAIGQRPEFSKGGAIVDLHVPVKGFSVTDITRIVESNGGKVLFTSVAMIPNDNDNLKVTVKFHKDEVLRVIAALERFEYKIIDKYLDDLPSDENFDRLNHLFKFLNI